MRTMITMVWAAAACSNGKEPPAAGSSDPNDTATTVPQKQTGSTAPADTTSPSYHGDCDPLDPAIGPDAADVDGDGIDSDCDGQDGPSIRPARVFRSPGPGKYLDLSVGADQDGDGQPDVVGTDSDGVRWFWSPMSDALLEVPLPPECTQVMETVGSPSGWTMSHEVCASGRTIRLWTDGPAKTFPDAETEAFPNHTPVAGVLQDHLAYAMEKPDLPGGPGVSRLVRWDALRERAERVAEFPEADHAVGGPPVVGDVDADGVDDLLVLVEGVLQLCLGLGITPVATCTAHPFPTAPTLADLGDVDGDGRADLFVWDDGAGSRVLLDVMDHLAQLDAAPSLFVDEPAKLVALTDVTGDGVEDIGVRVFGGAVAPGRLHVVAGPHAVGALPWEGSPSWAGVALGGDFGNRVVPADLDGDGLTDLAVGAPRDGYGAMYVIPGTELVR